MIDVFLLHTNGVPQIERNGPVSGRSRLLYSTALMLRCIPLTTRDILRFSPLLRCYFWAIRAVRKGAVMVIEVEEMIGYKAIKTN